MKWCLFRVRLTPRWACTDMILRRDEIALIWTVPPVFQTPQPTLVSAAGAEVTDLIKKATEIKADWRQLTVWVWGLTMPEYSGSTEKLELGIFAIRSRVIFYEWFWVAFKVEPDNVVHHWKNDLLIVVFWKVWMFWRKSQGTVIIEH